MWQEFKKKQNTEICLKLSHHGKDKYIWITKYRNMICHVIQNKIMSKNMPIEVIVTTTISILIMVHENVSLWK